MGGFVGFLKLKRVEMPAATKRQRTNRNVVSFIARRVDDFEKWVYVSPKVKKLIVSANNDKKPSELFQKKRQNKQIGPAKVLPKHRILRGDRQGASSCFSKKKKT